VCDPKSASCIESNCSQNVPCVKATDACHEQVGTIGACYASCTPLGSNPCDAMNQCVALNASQTLGRCERLGTNGPGEQCDPSPKDITTDCVADHVCDGSVCRQICDYWSSNPTCSGTDMHCSLGGVCAGANDGDGAAINAACSSSANYCGLQGNAWRGFCDGYSQTGGSAHGGSGGSGSAARVCRKLCRAGGTDCAALTGLVCKPLISDDVGLCLP
jgi:hypothetical protein